MFMYYYAPGKLGWSGLIVWPSVVLVFTFLLVIGSFCYPIVKRKYELWDGLNYIKILIPSIFYWFIHKCGNGVYYILRKLGVIWFTKKVWSIFKYLFPATAYILYNRVWSEMIVEEGPTLLRQILWGVLFACHYPVLNSYTSPEELYAFILRRFFWSIKSLAFSMVYTIPSILVIVFVVAVCSISIFFFLLFFFFSYLKFNIRMGLFRNKIFFPKISLVLLPTSIVLYKAQRASSIGEDQDLSEDSTRRMFVQLDLDKQKRASFVENSKKQLHASLINKIRFPQALAVIAADSQRGPIERSFVKLIWINDMILNKDIVNRLDYSSVVRASRGRTADANTGRRDVWLTNIPYQTSRCEENFSFFVNSGVPVSLRKTLAVRWVDLDYEQYVVQLVFNRGFNKLNFSQLSGFESSNQHASAGLGVRVATYNVYSPNIKIKAENNPLLNVFSSKVYKSLNKLHSDSLVVAKARPLSLGKKIDVTYTLKGLRTIYEALPIFKGNAPCADVYNVDNYLMKQMVSKLSRTRVRDAKFFQQKIAPFRVQEHSRLHFMKYETRPDRIFAIPFSLENVVRPLLIKLMDQLVFDVSLDKPFFTDLSKLRAVNSKLPIKKVTKLDKVLKLAESLIFDFFNNFLEDEQQHSDLIDQNAAARLLTYQKSKTLTDLFDRLDKLNITLDGFFNNKNYPKTILTNNQKLTSLYFSLLNKANLCFDGNNSKFDNDDLKNIMFYETIKILADKNFNSLVKHCTNDTGRLTNILIYREMLKMLRKSFSYFKPATYRDRARNTVKLARSFDKLTLDCQLRTNNLKLLTSSRSVYNNFTAIYNRSLTAFNIFDTNFMVDIDHEICTSETKTNNSSKTLSRLLSSSIWSWLLADVGSSFVSEQYSTEPMPFLSFNDYGVSNKNIKFSALSYDPSGSLGSLPVKLTEYFEYGSAITSFADSNLGSKYFFADKKQQQREDFYEVHSKMLAKQTRHKSRTLAFHNLTPFLLINRRVRARRRNPSLLEKFKAYKMPMHVYSKRKKKLIKRAWLSVDDRFKNKSDRHMFYYKQQANKLNSKDYRSFLTEFRMSYLYKPSAIKRSVLTTERSFEEGFFALLGQRLFVPRNPIRVKPITKLTAWWRRSRIIGGWYSETVASLSFFNYFWLGGGRNFSVHVPFFFDSREYRVLKYERGRQLLRKTLEDTLDRIRYNKPPPLKPYQKEVAKEKTDYLYYKRYIKRRPDFEEIYDSENIRIALGSTIVHKKIKNRCAENRLPLWFLAWFLKTKRALYRKYGCVSLKNQDTNQNAIFRGFDTENWEYRGSDLPKGPDFLKYDGQALLDRAIALYFISPSALKSEYSDKNLYAVKASNIPYRNDRPTWMKSFKRFRKLSKKEVSAGEKLTNLGLHFCTADLNAMIEMDFKSAFIQKPYGSKTSNSVLLSMGGNKNLYSRDFEYYQNCYNFADDILYKLYPKTLHTIRSNLIKNYESSVMTQKRKISTLRLRHRLRFHRKNYEPVLKMIKSKPPKIFPGKIYVRMGIDPESAGKLKTRKRVILPHRSAIRARRAKKFKWDATEHLTWPWTLVSRYVFNEVLVLKQSEYSVPPHFPSQNPRTSTTLPIMFSDRHYPVFWEYKDPESFEIYNKLGAKIDNVYPTRKSRPMVPELHPSTKPTPPSVYFSYASRASSLERSFLYGLHNPLIESAALNEHLIAPVFDTLYSLRDMPWWVQRFSFRKVSMTFHSMSDGYHNIRSAAKVHVPQWWETGYDEYERKQKNHFMDRYRVNNVNRGFARYRYNFRHLLRVSKVNADTQYTFKFLPYSYACVDDRSIDEDDVEERLEELSYWFEKYALSYTGSPFKPRTLRKKTFFSVYLKRTLRKTFTLLPNFYEDSRNNHTIKKSRVSYIVSKLATSLSYGQGSTPLRYSTVEPPPNRMRSMKEAYQHYKQHGDFDEHLTINNQRYRFHISFMWFFVSKNWSDSRPSAPIKNSFLLHLERFLLSAARFTVPNSFRTITRPRLPRVADYMFKYSLYLQLFLFFSIHIFSFITVFILLPALVN